MVDNSDFLDPDGFSGDIRRDTLRDRIEHIIETHTLINGSDECTCGVLWEIQDGFHSTDGSTCYDNHLAGVIADFVTDEKREPAVPENKSLRDRIIAAIAGADRDWNSDYPDMADAVIAELTHAIPPIVATAIQGYAQSELAAMSYHGGSKDAFDLMEKMNREALQIALYATTHKDWNG